MNECSVCLREQAIEALLQNPSDETRRSLFELVGFEQGFVLSNIDLTKNNFCDDHKNFESYRNFLLLLNDCEVVKLLFGSGSTEIRVN